MENSERLLLELARLKQLKAIQKKALTRYRKANAKTGREIQIRQATQEVVDELLAGQQKWEKKLEDMRREHRTYKEEASSLEAEYRHLEKTSSIFEEAEAKRLEARRTEARRAEAQRIEMHSSEGPATSESHYASRSLASSVSSFDFDAALSIDNSNRSETSGGSSRNGVTSTPNRRTGTPQSGARSITDSLVNAGKRLKSNKGRGRLRAFVRSLSSDDLDDAFT